MLARLADRETDERARRTVGETSAVEDAHWGADHSRLLGERAHEPLRKAPAVISEPRRGAK